MDDVPPATKKVKELHVRKSNDNNINGIEEIKAGEVTKKSGSTLLHEVLKLLLKILVIVLVFMLMFTFLFGTTRIINNSMEPNLKEGDRVIYYRLDKNYVATNCVAFRYNGQTQVMRVVAVAGDTVDMTADGLVINGALQSEPDPSKDTLPFKEGTTYPVKLKKGEVFLMGDNRPESVDSREFGPVNAKETLGELMTVIRSER